MDAKANTAEGETAMEKAFRKADAQKGSAAKRKNRFGIDEEPVSGEISVDERYLAELKELKEALPEKIRSWASKLTAIRTLPDADARAKRSADEDALIERISSYAKGTFPGAEELTDEQKREIGDIASLAFADKMTISLYESGYAREDLVGLCKLLVEFGAIRPPKDGEKENFGKMAGRIVYAGKFHYVANFSREHAAPWVSGLNDMWDVLLRREYVKRMDEQKAFRNAFETIPVSDILDGKTGVAFLDIPFGKVTVNGETRKLLGGQLLVKSDSKNVWPIDAIGPFSRRLERIINPFTNRGHGLDAGREGDRAIRRGFPLHEISKLDPRPHLEAGKKVEEVRSALEELRPPHVERKRFSDDEDFRSMLADQRVLWSILGRGLVKEISREVHREKLAEELETLGKKGDVEPAMFFKSTEDCRTVLTYPKPWKQGKAHYSRPAFALVRRDGKVAFDGCPDRVKPIFEDVKEGEFWPLEEAPGALVNMLPKIKERLEKAAREAEAKDAEVTEELSELLKEEEGIGDSVTDETENPAEVKAKVRKTAKTSKKKGKDAKKATA